MFGFGRVMLTE